MSQGHVNTTDHDGKPLLLLFLLDDEEDAEEIQKNLDNQVKVLRGFVTAWNRGVKVSHWFAIVTITTNSIR